MKNFMNYLTTNVSIISISEWISSHIIIFMLCFLSISLYWDCGSITKHSLPDPPTELTAEAVSSSLVTLSWQDNSDNEEDFRLEKKISDGNFVEICESSINAESYSDTDVTPETTYTYRVRAHNDVGYSNYSNEVIVTTPSAETPEAPSNLTVQFVTYNQINLTWQDNSDNEEGFKIEKKISDSSFFEICELSPNAVSYNETYVTLETTNTYRVRAYNDVGYSDYSNEVVVYPEQNCTESDLLWQNYSLSESYEGNFTVDFEGKPESDNMDGIFGLSGGEGTGFTDYAVLVRFNETGMIDARNGDLYEADENVPYSAGVSYQFHLTIDVLSHTYSVYVTPAGSSEQTIATDYAFRTEQSDVTKLDNWGLWADADYSFQVCNVVAENTAPEPTETPEAPSNLMAPSVTYDQIDLSWQDNSDSEEEFRLERKISDGSFVEIYISSPNVEYFCDTDVTPETTYTYRVRAHNDVGYSDYSNEVSATTPSAPQPTEAIIIDHTCTKLSYIPAEYVVKVKEELSVHYCGRSHASQIYSKGLEEVDNNGEGNWDYYSPDNDTPSSNDSRLDLVRYIGSDPGIEPHEYFGGSSDVPAWDTRPYPIENYLDSHTEINVAGIEWCGELHLTNQGANSVYVDGYLRAMTNLEERYNGTNDRKITFVYFTTNTQYRDDDTDMGGSNLDEKQARAHLNNERIRAHCRENNCVLYDFADLDIYCPVDINSDFDPNSDNWIKEPNRSAYIRYSDETHDSELREISFPVSYMGGPGNMNPLGWGNYNITYYHTTLEHAEIKGQAFWYMLARIAGWDGQ